MRDDKERARNMRGVIHTPCHYNWLRAYNRHVNIADDER